MKLATDPMPFPADPRGETIAAWPPGRPARSPLGTLAARVQGWFADGPFAIRRRAALAGDHPAAIGASDRELARLDRARWTVEDARTDTLRRLGGHRRLAL